MSKFKVGNPARVVHSFGADVEIGEIVTISEVGGSHDYSARCKKGSTWVFLDCHLEAVEEDRHDKKIAELEVELKAARDSCEEFQLLEAQGYERERKLKIALTAVCAAFAESNHAPRG